MSEPRFKVIAGKQHKKNVRYDLYRDGKIVLQAWSGGKHPPGWLRDWIAALNARDKQRKRGAA